MKNKKLSSVLAEQLASFIAWKSQQQSPKSNPVDPVVFALDELLIKRFSEAKHLTYEIFTEFMINSKSDRLKITYEEVFRSLARYLNAITKSNDNFVPPLKRKINSLPPFEERLKCGMKHHILNYIKMKRLAGNPFICEVVFLRFDRMMCSEFPGEDTLTKKSGLRWVELCSEGVGKSSDLRSISPIRGMALYLNNCGIPCYVIPSGIVQKPPRKTPHIIIETELKAFFKSADSLKLDGRTPVRHIVAPCAFRLLYACGIRVSEVLRLKRADIDLEIGKIFIRESKSRGLRVVIMHDDMRRVMQAYDREISVFDLRREWFFPGDAYGNRLESDTFGYWFHTIWDHLPEAQVSKPPAFTPSDFRHLFALSVINKWYRNGENLNALEPYLAVYMGHSNFEMTSYYTHIAECFFGDLCAILDSKTAETPVMDDEYEDLFEDEPYDI